jgi:hypothetical protein
MSPPTDSSPLDLGRLSKAELKDLVLKLLAKVADLDRTAAAQRDEIAAQGRAWATEHQAE